MTAPPTLPDAQPNADQPTRSDRLLDLVRKLVDYGKELAGTIRRRAFTDPDFGKCHFGTSNVAQILASISRGLHRANALEARIVRNATRLDAAPRTAASTPRSRPRRPAATPAAPAADDAETRLAHLPTPAQIAAEVRRRPIGAVIADICRDLGILPDHPLWRELQRVMFEHRGNYARLVLDLTDRAMAAALADWPPGVPFSWPKPPPFPSPPPTRPT